VTDHRHAAGADAAGRTPDDPRPHVPDLIGLSLEEACEVAAWAGIKVTATSTERTHGPRGEVVAQTPSPGTRMEALWRVHVLVSAPRPPGTPSGSEADDRA
jgi:beta-lactam-binding protein with PASTA domain